ncbi:CaiB/BaiF CoA transferase family protein [Pseudorhodoplanes sp.]|uniref:CaiB/BaiF CoA transferase family protein n=1 Tax=Pseudorhodoplanes sp. TaxID=1934341 RepID=UPI003D0FB1EA
MSGIRVLDASSIIMGPLAAQYLGQMGADVIKVEAPGGDLTRAIGPHRSSGMTALFLNCNQNKRSIIVDMKTSEGREIFRRLVETADVIIHSVRTAAAEKLGMSYAALSKYNSKLIYCHLKGYADEGAYAGQAALDDIIQAISGLASLQSAVAGEPRYIPTSVTDKICAVHAVLGIAAALVHRERTGKGQEVSLAMFETMVGFNLVEHLWGHVFEPPIASLGYDSVRAGTRRPYKTKDGFLAFLPYTDQHWRVFFERLGRPEMMSHPAFANYPARQKNYQVTMGELIKVLATRNTAEWIALFKNSDIPMAQVNSLETLLDDPHLSSIDYWKFSDHPTEGRLRAAPFPLDFSESPVTKGLHAPRLGENTREILLELGHSNDAIASYLKTFAPAFN